MGKAATAVLLVGAIFLSLVEPAWAGPPEYSIKYVLENADALLNQPVKVKGLVTESVVQRQPFDPKIKGWFQLQDADGQTIQVWTSSALPPKGEFREVAGVVTKSGGVVCLQEIPAPSWQLWAVLAGLVIVALILMALLIRSRGRIEQPEAYRHLEDVESAGEVVCPSCGSTMPADAQFCTQCGARLSGTTQEGAEEHETTVVEPEEGRQRGPSGTIVLLPGEAEAVLADLTVVEGPGARTNTQFPLRKTRQKIGRAASVDIRLNDDRVSSEHALIWWEEDGFYIQDLASTNGTFINGSQITRQRLEDGDEIQVGTTKMVFRLIKRRTQ